MHALFVRDRLTRALSVMVLVAAAFAAAPPAGAQDQQGPDPWVRTPYYACPVGDVPESGFTDIGRGVGGNDLRCVVWYGISSGVTATEYRPGKSVTRGQMATFIANLIDYAAEDGETQSLPEYDGDNQFSDAADSVHVANINRLAQAGIVQGGPGQRPASEFGPNLAVRRDQMATFLNGAQEFMTGAAFVSDNDFFSDDDGSVHHDNINAIAEHGVTGGATRDARYLPGGAVLRGQMASFLMRLLDIHVFSRSVTTPVERGTEQSNESFVFDEVVDTASVSFTALTNEGATQFEVTGVEDGPVSLALFQCRDVFARSGMVAFRDHAEPEGQADLTVDNTGAVIEQVNGTPRTQRDNYVADVEASDGTVTFVVDSTSADCTVAVAFADANDNDAVDVSEQGVPSEDFAASTPLLYLPGSGDDGAFTGTVRFVDRAGGRVVVEVDGTLATYRFDALDDFVAGDERLAAGQFGLRVSPGDTLAADDYAADGNTTFELTDDAPPAVTGVSATYDHPDVVVEWTPTATAQSYRVYRLGPYDRRVEGAVEQETAVLVGEVQGQTGRFTDADVDLDGGQGDFTYRVRAVEEGDEAAVTAGSSDEVTAHGPRMLDATVTRDGGTAGQLDARDRHRFIFDRPMDPDVSRDRSIAYVVVSSSDEIEIGCETASDSDPETTDCGLNSDDVTIDGTTYEPGRVLTVNIGTDYSQVLDRRNVSYPVTVSDTTWEDRRGNRVDLQGSPDTTLEP